MLKFTNLRNYIIAESQEDVRDAKQVDLCRHIVLEKDNCIYLYNRNGSKWTIERYVFFGNAKDEDMDVTGLQAYVAFYRYCGKDNIDNMKAQLPIMPIWESNEQLHFYNVKYAREKIYKNIYEFDANSAFTYGVMQLPEEFNMLKDYMQGLYDKKQNAANKKERSHYKKLQNFLVGYFARIKEFVYLRSEIIGNCNKYIKKKMNDVRRNGGTVYLSNTDSIVTDDKGAEVLQKCCGEKVGQFKLEMQADKLRYFSSNAYQIGSKVVYSGVGYFAKRHTDLFEDLYGTQRGSLVYGYDSVLNLDEPQYSKLCKVGFGKIEVAVVNALGEPIKKYIYKIQ